MEIDVVSAPPGEVEADVLAFSVSEPAQLVGALTAVGFDDVDVSTTGRFFLLGSATAR